MSPTECWYIPASHSLLPGCFQYSLVRKLSVVNRIHPGMIFILRSNLNLHPPF